MQTEANSGPRRWFIHRRRPYLRKVCVAFPTDKNNLVRLLSQPQTPGGWPIILILGRIKKAGAPSLRSLQGRVRCCRSHELCTGQFRSFRLSAGLLPGASFDFDHSELTRPWYPPLQRTQGWGTLSRGDPTKPKEWATRQNDAGMIRQIIFPLMLVATMSAQGSEPLRIGIVFPEGLTE